MSNKLRNLTKRYSRRLSAMAAAALLAFSCHFPPAAQAADTAPAADILREDLDSSLIAAARAGSTHQFNTAVGLGANINAVDRHGTNGVLAAVEGRQDQMLRMLLDKGVDANARGASGFTPLTYAAMTGALANLRALLRAGAHVNEHNAIGESALHLAAAFGRLDIIAELASARARIDDLNDAGETPLLAAARAGQLKSVEALLARGADRNAIDKVGRQRPVSGHCRRS